MIGKPIISLLILVTIAPLLVILTLAFSNPEEFGGNLDLQSILMMYLFALITVPLWTTYIPSIILTPIILHRMQKIEAFYRISILTLIVLSALSGGFIGILVMAPILFISQAEQNNLFFSWILSGAISGSITLTIIVLIYRMGKSKSLGREA